MGRASPRFFFLLLLVAFAARAAEPGERIDVTVRGIVKSGVMAIGAETTGTTITANGITWDLEMRGKQTSTASGLNGRLAVVTGELTVARGVERRDRQVVKVKSIRAATP